MKLDIYFKIYGTLTGKSGWMPNSNNPAEVANVNELVKLLVDRIPDSESMGMECRGLMILPHGTKPPGPDSIQETVYVGD